MISQRIVKEKKWREKLSNFKEPILNSIIKMSLFMNRDHVSLIEGTYRKRKGNKGKIKKINK